MSGWWRQDARHIMRYGHWPEWRQFDRVAICERCIKPPSRGRLVPSLRLAFAPHRGA